MADNNSWRIEAIMLVMALVLGGGASVCRGQGADDPIFSGGGILDLTIEAPIKQLMAQPGDSDETIGEIELSDGTKIPMRCSKYGISRLRECSLASLKITVERDDVQNTPFEGHQTLRMVTPCKLRGNYDKYTMLEYLVYMSYPLLADPALRAQLVNVSFRDTKNPGKEESGYAFFVEDIDGAATAGNLEWLERESVNLDDLDLQNLTVLTLFEYMIGNTDWSALRGRKGGRCCHNVAIFGANDGEAYRVLPFDFDQTGVVNPPYAVPSESLGARKVTDRVYRGFCELNDFLPEALGVFRQRRSDIEALFMDDALPYPKERVKAWKYIEEFYVVIDNPKKIDKKIVNRCR